MEERGIPSPRGIPTMHTGAELQEHGYYQSPQYDPRKSAGVSCPPPQTRPASDIEEALDDQSSAIDKLGDRLNTLEKRLGTVLIPITENPNVGQPVRHYQSELGRMLGDRAEYIRLAAAKVQELLDRLAV